MPREANQQYPGADVDAESLPAIVQPLQAALRRGGDPVPPLLQAARALGFRAFSFVVLRKEMEDDARDAFILSSQPAMFIDECTRARVLSFDPRVRAASRSPVPIVWDRFRLPDDEQARLFLALAGRNGVRSGVFQLVRQPDPSIGVWFSLTSDAERFEDSAAYPIDDRMGDIVALGAYLFHLSAGVLFPLAVGDASFRTLTTRERECLEHVATGCTSREVAARLDISERTVNAHLEQAIRKLGAANRQQAVARAIRLAIIRP